MPINGKGSLRTSLSPYDHKGGYLVALCLCGIITNLLSYSGFYDIALRDFGLMLGAIALGRLSENFSPA